MKLKQWIHEQMTFETFNGWLVFIPWGAGFLYFAFKDLPIDLTPSLSNIGTFFRSWTGYTYGMVSLGLVLIIWGIRKGTVNRVKQKLKMEQLIQKRIQEIQSENMDSQI